MKLTSTAFAEGETIPPRYTCDGPDVSPPLAITGIPEGTAALAVIMDDPDAPRGTWDHWVAYDVPVAAEIPEDAGPLGTMGVNTNGEARYHGPCPPPGVHRYFFRVLALDAPLGLRPGATKRQVLAALEGHVLAEATLMGRYSRRR